MRTTTMKRLELLPRFRAEPTGLNKKDFKGKGIFQIDSTKRKEKIQQKSRCKESVEPFLPTKLRIHKKSASNRKIELSLTTEK